MPCHIIAFEEDLIAECAQTVINDYQDQLPDLSQAVILLPDEVWALKPQINRLRQLLLDRAAAQGLAGLIPPAIETLSGLIAKQPSHAVSMTHYQERLILASQLRSLSLFPNQSVWNVSQALVKLFSDISELSRTARYDAALLKQHLDRLAEEMTEEGPGLSTLSDDATMLLMLWRVWEEATDDPAHKTRGQVQREALINNTLVAPDQHVYLCGIERLTPCQIDWAKTLYNEGRLTLLSQAGTETRYPYPSIQLAQQISGETIAYPDESNTAFDHFVDTCFATPSPERSFLKRGQALLKAVPESPLADRISLFAANSFEQHAWGIYMQVKRWIDAGHNDISIIYFDRKLARRLRAIFDRYGIVLQDPSGWELSTTSSSTILSALLPEPHSKLDPQTLKNVLRSPYSQDPDRRLGQAAKLSVIHWVEKSIRQQPQLPRDTEELIHILHKQMPKEHKKLVVSYVKALNQLYAQTDNKERPLIEYFETLSATMKDLGIDRRLALDNAGRALLRELNQMREAATMEQAQGSYAFWRSWILHQLEQVRYRETPTTHGIQLLTMRQARLWRSEAVVLAGLDYERLPETPQYSPVINERTYEELGLETREMRKEFDFFLLRSILSKHPQILMTYQAQHNGQIKTPSPWIEAIQRMHHNVYGDDLVDLDLPQLADHCQHEAIKLNIDTPLLDEEMPAPHAPPNSWPTPLSISDYKTLIDCPYRFFVKKSLRLYESKMPGKHLNKATFGSLIHRVIEALHRDVDGLPGPMNKTWDEENKLYAETIARDIANQVFEEYAQHYFLNRYWKDQAAHIAKRYVAWLMQWVADIRNQNQDQDQDQEQDLEQDIQRPTPQVDLALEQEYQEVFGAGLSLRGRIDCFIQIDNQRGVIDFKTGKLPSKKSIENGEDVQITCYSLLTGYVDHASYLSLDATAALELKPTFDAEAIESLCNKELKRLSEVYEDYDEGAALPASGNDAVCRYCPWEGVCRRPAWKESRG